MSLGELVDHSWNLSFDKLTFFYMNFMCNRQQWVQKRNPNRGVNNELIKISTKSSPIPYPPCLRFLPIHHHTLHIFLFSNHFYPHLLQNLTSYELQPLQQLKYDLPNNPTTLNLRHHLGCLSTLDECLFQHKRTIFRMLVYVGWISLSQEKTSFRMSIYIGWMFLSHQVFI